MTSGFPSCWLRAGRPSKLFPEPLMQYRRYQEQQIGPGPLSVQRRVAQARDRGADFHREVIAQLVNCTPGWKAAGQTFAWPKPRRRRSSEKSHILSIVRGFQVRGWLEFLEYFERLSTGVTSGTLRMEQCV